MIDRRLEGLEGYVGVKLRGDASVAAELARVVRTKGYGGWKDWFTAEDVNYLRPVLQPFLDRFYRGADWELNASPSLPAEFGSGYVERIVNDRRASANLSPFNFSFPAEL